MEAQGKKLALLMVYCSTDLYKSGGINVIHALESLCRYTGMDFEGFVHGTAEDEGDTKKDPILMDQAYQLGKKIAIT